MMRWWMLALMACGSGQDGTEVDDTVPVETDVDTDRPDTDVVADTDVDTDVVDDTDIDDTDVVVEPSVDELVLLVDITHEGIASPETVPQLKLELDGFVHAVAANADRHMGVVYYAGVSESISEILPLASHLDEVSSAVGDVEPCSVDQDAWYYFWRHYNLSSIQDPELGGLGYDYAFVGRDGTPNVALSSPEGQLILFMMAPFGSGMTDLEFDQLELTEPLQCGFWQVSQFSFESGDPRRRRQRALGLGPDSLGTLACHDGHYLDGDPDRFDQLSGILGLDCTDVSGVAPLVPNTEDAAGQPLPQYGGPLLAGVRQMADFSYTQAGSRPGRALEEALEMLDGTSGDEEVVVLVAGNGYRCPPTLAGVRAADCAVEFRAEMLDQVALLEARGVHTHVVGVVAPGSEDELNLAAMVTGQGGFYQVDTVDEVGAALAAIAAGLP